MIFLRDQVAIGLLQQCVEVVARYVRHLVPIPETLVDFPRLSRCRQYLTMEWIFEP